MILLTDKEIGVALDYYTGSDLGYPHTSSEYVLGEHRAIAKAQAKKMLEWGIEPCLKHTTGGGVFTRRECPQCWQQLRKEIENREMKTTAPCPKCGAEIPHLIYSYISGQEVTLRYIKGDKYVLGDELSFGDTEIDSDSGYFKCPLCDSGVCSTAGKALEFLRGSQD